mgnify:CR=1 FL=1
MQKSPTEGMKEIPTEGMKVIFKGNHYIYK